MTPLIVLLVPVAVLLAFGLYELRRRRREARRRGDAVFLAHALNVAQTKRRRRPKVDRRIQRRRYGS